MSPTRTDPAAGAAVPRRWTRRPGPPPQPLGRAAWLTWTAESLFLVIVSWWCYGRMIETDRTFALATYAGLGLLCWAGLAVRADVAAVAARALLRVAIWTAVYYHLLVWPTFLVNRGLQSRAVLPMRWAGLSLGSLACMMLIGLASALNHPREKLEDVDRPARPPGG